MPFKDTIIRSAKPKNKTTDEKGLHLLVLVRKSDKYFRLDYRYTDKRKTLELGIYPQTSKNHKK